MKSDSKNAGEESLMAPKRAGELSGGGTEGVDHFYVRRRRCGEVESKARNGEKEGLGRQEPGFRRCTHGWNAPSIECMKIGRYIQHEGKSYTKYQRKVCIIGEGGRF